jgi:hypothetical protein
LITGKGSGEDGIDSVEAKRSPLSPGFTLQRGYSKKPGDNSDQKNDPDSERSAIEYRIN